MLIHSREEGFVRPDAVEIEKERLERLLADLTALERNLAPTRQDLVEAPILDRYHIAMRPVPCLVGEATGHPRLTGVGREICTTELWVFCADAKWARTHSRWYRLARPADGAPPGGWR